MNVLAVVLVSGGFLRPAQAVFSNYNSILLGDQSAGMAGAATALGTDSSSAAWYNPAGLAALKGNSFSSAVGIYKKFETVYGQGDDLINAALRANQGFFRALPSSSGSVVRPKQLPWFQDYTFALSILVPDFENYRGDVNLNGNNVSTLSLLDESLWVGGGIAKQVSSNEYLGLTVYYTARSLTKTVVDRIYNNSTDFNIYTEERTLTQNAIVFILGYLYQWSPNWSVGVSARPPSIQVAGRATYAESLVEEVGFAGAPVINNKLDSKGRIPPKLAVGIAYRDLEAWIVALDVALYGSASYRDIELDGKAENIRHRQIVNVHLGAEYHWLEWLKLRSGFFTNYSSHPWPEIGEVKGQGDRVDQMGFAANAAFLSGNIEFTFGGYYTGGRGESVQRVEGVYQKVSKTQNTFTMLVGTSYYF